MSEVNLINRSSNDLFIKTNNPDDSLNKEKFSLFRIKVGESFKLTEDLIRNGTVEIR